MFLFTTSNMLRKLLTLCLCAYTAAAASVPCKVNGRTYNATRVIARDISILGGGSGGTYSAIRLRDFNQSVVVVESEDRLGGNTQTYTDPVSGVTIDYGVQVWHSVDIVLNYFKRLNVALTNDTSFSPANTSTVYVDFLTGKPTSSPPDFTKALIAYATEVAKYPFLESGWNLTYPVPEDLLLPFGQFATKHSLEALVPFLFQFVEGIGNLLTIPTVYVMKYLGINSLQSLASGFLTTLGHDNSLLYLAAEKELKGNLVLGGTVLDIERDSKGVTMVVRKGSETILIRSEKLIVAIQPKYDALSKFMKLSTLESKVFKQFNSSEYFAGIIKTGIPINTTIDNSGPGHAFGIPEPPCLYTISQTNAPGLQLALYLSTTPTHGDEIADEILKGVKKLQIPGMVHSEPKFEVTTIHRPFELSVSSEAIKNGFYRDLLSLQGKEKTWYISATMHAHDSTLIWQYAETLFEDIAK